jgi:hypothetical protein
MDMFRVALLPNPTIPKLRGLGLATNNGEVPSVAFFVAFDPANPMHPAWQSPNARQAAKTPNTLRLLCFDELVFRVLRIEFSARISLMRPSFLKERNNHA